MAFRGRGVGFQAVVSDRGLGRVSFSAGPLGLVYVLPLTRALGSSRTAVREESLAGRWEQAMPSKQAGTGTGLSPLHMSTSITLTGKVGC
jgi:hypothetical protein